VPTRRGGRCWGLLLGAGVFGLIVTSCSSEPSPTVAVPTPPSAAQATPAAPRPDGPVTIAFAGDTHFVGASARALSGFGPITDVLARADIAMVNLETAVTARGTPTDKEFVFRSPPSSFAALREAGIDVVSEANNHGVDYGLAGLHDSIHYAHTAGFPVVGIGYNARQAFRPYRTTVRGLRVAIIGATDVIDSSLISSWTATADQPGLASAKERQELLHAVRKARHTADVVVVFLHWGTETVTCPTAAQHDLESALQHAGADAIVGSHAHVLLGGGWDGSTYVDYGLGNFVFYSSGGLTADSGVLTLTFRRHAVTRAFWKPAVVSDGIPVPLSGTAAAAARRSWESLRSCTGLSAQPTTSRSAGN
jgi:poly-gamma-glutamate capsule biosynthesis protein CapA/YwtB (metallophosphatase superfamily)